MFALNKTAIILVSGIVTTACIFCSGYYLGKRLTEDDYTIKIQEMEKHALNSEVDVLSKNLSTQKQLENAVNEVLKNEQQENFDLDAKYINSINSLHQSAESNSDEVHMPAVADATAKPEHKTANKCHRSDNRNFNRLSERALKLAKEHDELKIKYNSLLVIYEETAKKLKAFE